MTSSSDQKKSKRLDQRVRLALIGILGTSAACSVAFYLRVLFQMDWTVPSHRNSAFYTSLFATLELSIYQLPQVGAGLLFLLTVISITIAIKKHRLTAWRTYLPATLFVTFCVLALLIIPVWSESSVRAKLADPEGGETWCIGMVGRVMGGWPTPPHCALSDDVAIVIWYWSFVTPDGRMPVLAWSDKEIPNPELPTRPISCKHLNKNWYFCYLANPYQLTYDYSGLCDFRNK
jgi:hypothetical protein